ncbi:MAG TPA: response regulator [Anaerolineales bacterium]|nr:response regulator [Anaerolineales bacterium]
MRPNILYIEDHNDNMTLVKRIFRPDRYNLVEARNGLQGVSIAENQNIDLILLDINLPDIDGYEVARRLRASLKKELANTPIVAVTANAMKNDEKKVREAGCDDYMSKPINIVTLMEKVDTLIANKI